MSTPVLVVERNAADFRSLQDALSQAGSFELELTRVDHLHSAILQLQAHRFEAVILDLSLPETDGLEGVRRLHDAAPELPIVVITGNNDLELALGALREGAQDYVVKGQVDGRLLIRAVRQAAERIRFIQDTKRSEGRFRSLLENAIDIITVVDGEGKISYASPSVHRVLGYTPEELVGVSAASLVHGSDRPRISRALKMPPSDTACTVEFRMQHRDGRWLTLEAVGRSALKYPSVSGVVVNARDITDRKKPHERERAAKDRLQAVIETSPLAIFVLDLTGTVLAWNKAAEKTFGWTEAEVLGHELPTVRAQGQAEFHARLLRVRAGHPFGEIQARYARKDGMNIDVNIWTSPLRDEDVQVTGLVCMVADVTERRRLEEQLRQAQKMEAVGRLAGGVAHDFNNLLTVITGYSQLASSRLSAGSQESCEVQEVLLAAGRAANLTKQLLTLSRRTIGEPTILDLNSLVTDMKRMFERLLGEDIVLGAQLSPALQCVRADRGQIEMVFLNLVVNARDAMPGGGHLFIETTNVDVSDSGAADRDVARMSGPHVVLSISDTGIGMDDRVRAQLFEPFFTTKAPGKGTGLGLSTSYEIIRQHGGDISVYSEPGVGTTFKVYLPAAEAYPREEVSSPTPPQPGGIETILIVEDDPSVANVMRDALQMKGYRVLLTSNPKQALEAARENKSPIHLVVSDIVLRAMHGVDLMQQIRALRPSVRTLYVSGYVPAAMPGRHCLEPGSVFLQKPFGPDALAAKVREVLNQR